MQSLHLKLEAQAEYEEQYLTCRFWNKGTFSSSLNPNSSFVLEVFKKASPKDPRHLLQWDQNYSGKCNEII